MKYLYTPFDIAYYFIVENFTVSEEQKIINTLWQESNYTISSLYRSDKKRFANAIKKEIHKFDDLQLEYMDELNLIFQEMGSHFRIGESDFEQGVIESYFKLIKLRLTYSKDVKYCKIKLRNLIGRFGYKKRTVQLVEYIIRTLNSLGLVAYLRGWNDCDIATVKLDEMIIIRLK